MIRLGILGCSAIAYNRFMPAALNIPDLQVVCVGEEYDKTKIKNFCDKYNVEGMESFEEVIERDDLDAIYVPQPPALHYKWGRKALEAGKHVLIEKPSTTSYEHSSELVELARTRGLALHENYMFQYHSQIHSIHEILKKGAIGEVRMYKLYFGFPKRAENDFRYNKALGGGALLDAGGYTLRLATLLMGKTIKVDTARLNYLPGYEVDMYGSATLSNDAGATAQIGFGMDNGYQCSLEVWGSKGTLTADRIFTAPDGFEPVVRVSTNVGVKVISLQSDSHFRHSIVHFIDEIENNEERTEMYEQIILQSKLVEDVRKLGIRI